MLDEVLATRKRVGALRGSLLQAVPLPQVSPRQRSGGAPPASGPPLVYGQAASQQQRWGERSA